MIDEELEEMHKQVNNNLGYDLYLAQREHFIRNFFHPIISKALKEYANNWENEKQRKIKKIKINLNGY